MHDKRVLYIYMDDLRGGVMLRVTCKQVLGNLVFVLIQDKCLNILS